MSNYILTSDGELYHYGIKGQKWGVRRAQKKAARKAAREARDANLTPEQRKKRANIKKAVVIGSAVTASGLAIYGGVKLKKYLDNKKRIKTGEELARRVQYEFEKKMFEQKQMRDAARAAQRKIEQQAANEYLGGLGDRFMDTFKRQNGL